MNNVCSCLHFLDVANDSPITPAPAYRSATDDPPGTYLCSFQSKLSKAWHKALDIFKPGYIITHTALTTAVIKLKSNKHILNLLLNYSPLYLTQKKTFKSACSPVCLLGQNWKDPRICQFLQRVPRNLSHLKDVSICFQRLSKDKCNE